MKVAYVLYNERPQSGLVRTQVVSLLKEMKRQAPDLDLTLVAFWQPWVGWRHGNEIRDLRSEIESAGIRQIDNFWAVIPSRHFMYRVALFPVLRIWVSILMRSILKRRFDIVHARGYLPSYISTRLKRRFRHRTVFDMRSLWPKEHVSIGAWKVGEPIFRMWEAIEKSTLDDAEASIAVSGGMLEEIRRISDAANAVEIPISVDTGKFKFDPAARARRREEIGWSGRKIVAYQGSLGLLNRNIREVAEYFAFILKLMPELRFLILTANGGVDVSAIMGEYGIDPERFAVRHPVGAELNEWLSAADAGIHAMSPGPDSATRLGVKVVEYLSCSLPIIINPHVGAAADLVRATGAGVVIDAPEGEAARPRLQAFFENAGDIRDLARKVAMERFSVESCARKYLALYRSVFKDGNRWT